MNWSAIAFDWNQIRALLATIEEGSFSGAARALGQTQPTLSRQIAALESDLGVTLFERNRRATVPTGAALELVEHVRSMGEAAQRISLTASGQSSAIEGRVTVTATNIMASYYLPPIIKHIRETAPGIRLEIIASNELQDLQKREADIAIRHARPEQPDLIARLVGETTGHLYAHPDYLDRVGRPTCIEDINRLDFIGFEQNERVIEHLNAIGLNLTADNFRISCGSSTVHHALAMQGLGVTPMTRDWIEQHSELEELWPALPPIPVQTWLVTHRELNTSRRIRLVFDAIADGLDQQRRETRNRVTAI
ncbi:MAG: DNA-binding transcriptional LysR family regulator [Maricaulis maris]|jgi:DNA-binding transcriptional LysR family regulator|uniref:Transcriptional regulator, LysR family n=1 Tax=Maricaulis maris (strain MCS10) TaxID=394221 RepID=Q0API3_MARMM|nr:LysR family transcriptional regulator [Maricaulis maris]ABI65804.1 transcriptional regulator, LysR family [Maricaulis maris MCS10]